MRSTVEIKARHLVDVGLVLGGVTALALVAAVVTGDTGVWLRVAVSGVGLLLLFLAGVHAGMRGRSPALVVAGTVVIIAGNAGAAALVPDPTWHLRAMIIVFMQLLAYCEGHGAASDLVRAQLDTLGKSR